MTVVRHETEVLMELQDRQFPLWGRRSIAFAMVAALASLMLAGAGPAHAKRMSGTKRADRILGTAHADMIRSRGGNDRIWGRGGSDRLAGGAGRDRLAGGSGRDRLSGGRGRDRLNAVDGRADRVVNGGSGTDVCRVDPADQLTTRSCEIVRVVTPRAPRPPHGPGLPGVPGAPVVPGAPGVPGGPKVCAAPPEDAAFARIAHDDDPPPVFSSAFYAITTTITASADGMNDNELPISIEDVCDVPQSLATEAAQLVGGDGVAVIGPTTQVFDATGQQLTGAAATTALAEADTVVIKAQLMRPADWRMDEDGAPVPTFSVSRADTPD
jgi:hypothetical protein